MDLTKVVCSTPQEFHEEVVKWQKKGAAPIVRGRRLIAFGEVVAELATSRGGHREGAGRPKGNRTNTILVKVNDEAMERWRSGVSRTDQIETFLLSPDFKTE